MRKRLLAAVCVFCAASFGQQTLTVRQLSDFIHSSTHEMKGKESDKEVAAFLAKVKLSERLDDATIEEFQNEGAGRLTIAAVRALAERSASLPEAKTAAVATVMSVRKMPPPPSSEEQAAIIDSVRAYVLNYSQSLPDFLCYEVMQTYQAPRSSDHWIALDRVDSKLTYYQQKENYSPVAKNGKLTSEDYEKLKGSKSIGDFGSMLRGIFEPRTETRFEWRTWSMWVGQPSITFDYHVAQDRSNYEISAEGSHSVISAYSGSFVVDAKTYAVVKLTVKAEGLPADFPVKTVENTLVYRDAELSGHTFLLPAEIEIISDGTDFRSKINKQFKLYRKYTTDSEITFDSVDDPPPAIKKK